MFKRKVLSVAVVALVVAMMSSATSLYAADPAGEATLKMAPKSVSLIAHVEGKPVGELFQRFLKVVKADKELNSELSKQLPIMDAVADMVTRIDSVDAYVGVEGKGQPILLFAVRTKLTVEELVEQASKAIASDPAQKVELKAVKGENGRYTINFGPMSFLQAVNGKDASDVKDDVILVGLNGMTDNIIATLKTGPNDTLKELAKKADLSAPAWAVMELPVTIRGPETPKTVVVSVYPDGKKASTVVMNFATTEAAESTEKAFKTAVSTTQPSDIVVSPFFSMMELKRMDTEVTATVTVDDKFMDAAVKALKQARKMAKRAASMANVSAIGKGIMMYITGPDTEEYPNTFNDLISKQYATAQSFVSPMKQRKLKVDDKGFPAEDVDYIYIRPVSPNDDPSNIMIYEPLENWNGEGTVVGRADCTVTWMTAEQFKEAMKKTLENQAKLNKK